MSPWNVLTDSPNKDHTRICALTSDTQGVEELLPLHRKQMLIFVLLCGGKKGLQIITETF